MLVYWLPLGVLGNKRGKERKLLNKQVGAIYKKEREKNEKQESPDEQVLILPSTSTRDHILQIIVDDR